MRMKLKQEKIGSRKTSFYGNFPGRILYGMGRGRSKNIFTKNKRDFTKSLFVL